MGDGTETTISNKAEAKAGQSATQIRDRLNLLFSDTNHTKPPYGHGKSESWWTVIAGKDIFEAKRQAGVYMLSKQPADETTLWIKNTLRQAAMDAGRSVLMMDAIEGAHEAVTVRTSMGTYGYDETVVLKAMAIVVDDLNFDGKPKCLDLIEERSRAAENGFIPFGSIGAELVVYFSRPPLRA